MLYLLYFVHLFGKQLFSQKRERKVNKSLIPLMFQKISGEVIVIFFGEVYLCYIQKLLAITVGAVSSVYRFFHALYASVLR